MKIVINKCYGGFGLSDAAYERLIELGVPVRKYHKQERGDDGLYQTDSRNEGEVIFDRDLDESKDPIDIASRELCGRYWESWIRYESRNHPLVVQVVEELGTEANGRYAELKVVEVPDGIEWEISDYDGIECVHEKHRTWS